MSYRAILDKIDHKNQQEGSGKDKSRKGKANNRKCKGGKTIKNKRKRQKHEAFKKIQNLYNTNKKSLIASVLDDIPTDVQPPNIKDAYRQYNNLWSVEIKDGEEFEAKQSVDATDVFKPITIDEIEKAIRASKKKGACGPDKVSLTDISSLYETEQIGRAHV